MSAETVPDSSDAGGPFSSQLPRRAARIALILLMLAVIATSALWAIGGDSLRDFGSFVAAGRAAVSGRNPYSSEEPLVFRVEFDSLGIEAHCPNLNPPLSLPFFALLGRMDAGIAIQGWRLVSLAFYSSSLMLLIKWAPVRMGNLRILWTLSLAGFWQILELGQIYAPLVFAATAGWILLHRRHDVWGGVFIGCLVAAKPNLAVWPLFLLLNGQIAAGLTSLAVASVLTPIPALLYGASIYSQWLEASAQFTGLTFPGNSSLAGLTARFGSPSVGLMVATTLIVAAGYFVWRERPGVTTASALALIVSLLAGPIAWVGYTPVLLPWFFWTKWDIPMVLAAVILAVPFWLVLILFEKSWFWFVAAGWLYGWALLLLLISIARRLSAEASHPADTPPAERVPLA